MKLSDKNACETLMQCGDADKIKNVINSMLGQIATKAHGWERMQDRINYINQHYKDYELDSDTPETEQEDLSVDNFELHLCNKYRQLHKSAKTRNKEFNLTIADVRKLLQRKTCAYSGVKFERDGDNQRTIDRVDANLGYVSGNVVAVTHKANQLKNILFEKDGGLTTPEYLSKMLSNIQKYK